MESKNREVTTREAAEIAKQLGLSLAIEDISRMCAAGVLEGARKDPSGKWLVPVAAIETLARLKKRKLRLVGSSVAIVLGVAALFLAFPSCVRDAMELASLGNAATEPELTFKAVQMPDEKVKETKPFWYDLDLASSPVRLTSTYSHDQLVRDRGGYYPFGFVFPEVEVVMINHSAETVYLSRVSMESVESVPDLRPIPDIEDSPDHPGKFLVRNEGWGKLENATVSIGLPAVPAEFVPSYPDFSSKMTPADIAYTVTYKNQELDRVLLFDVEDILKPYGIAGREYRDVMGNRTGESQGQVTSLPAWKAMLGSRFENKWGRHDDPIPCLVSYSGTYTDAYGDSHEVSIEHVLDEIWPYYMSGGMGGQTIAEKLKLSLMVKGSNYLVSSPMNVSLVAGEAVRLSLRFQCDQSSFHSGTVSFWTTTGKLFASKPIAVDILVPEIVSRFAKPRTMDLP